MEGESQPTTEKVVPGALHQQGVDLREGQVFRSKEEVQHTIRMAALARCFDTKVKRSTKTVYVVECVGPNCKWACRASTYKNSRLWMIRKLVDEHSCDLNVRLTHKRRATYRQLGQTLVQRYVVSHNRFIPARLRQLHMQCTQNTSCQYQLSTQ